MDFRAFAIRQSTYSPGLRQPRHSHEHSNVTIVVAGQLHEAAEDGEYSARPCSVVLKGAGCEHEDRISGFGARTLTIQFDNASAVANDLRPRAWGWFDQPAIVRAALMVQNAFARRDAMQLERSAVTLVEATIAFDRTGRIACPPLWLQAVRAAVDEEVENPIRFEALARDFGLHPVYVSRAFRRHYGMSMTDYARAARIRNARHILSSSRCSVAAVAAEAGFSDASHLCRTFTQLLGITPRAYRRATTAKV